MIVITTHLETINLNKGDLRNMKKEELNKKIISWDDERWKEEVETKTSLKIYNRWKLKIKEDDL